MKPVAPEFDAHQQALPGKKAALVGSRSSSRLVVGEIRALGMSHRKQLRTTE